MCCFTVRTENLEGNQAHRAPEILNTFARYRADPDNVEVAMMDMSGQGAFETGVLLYWMAAQRDALPDYPAAYGAPGSVSYELDPRSARSELAVSLSIHSLILGLLECDPESRMSVQAANAGGLYNELDPPASTTAVLRVCVAQSADF